VVQGTSIQVRTGASTVLLNVPHPGTGFVWNYYEIEVFAHATTGWFRLYLNGVQIGEVTGINTGSALSRIRCGKLHAHMEGTDNITDIYVADEPLGDFRVVTLLPDGAGAHTDLIPEPTAANYTRVNTTTRDDTTYNHSNTPGDKDTYTYSDLPFSDVTVFAVAPAPRAQKVDAGSASGRAVLRTNSADFTGPDRILAAGSWQWFPTIWSANPDSGLPWEPAEVDAIEAGFEVRA
jgi:hypothetical protein